MVAVAKGQRSLHISKSLKPKTQGHLDVVGQWMAAREYSLNPMRLLSPLAFANSQIRATSDLDDAREDYDSRCRLNPLSVLPLDPKPRYCLVVGEHRKAHKLDGKPSLGESMSSLQLDHSRSDR